jgi:surface antigen
LVLSIAVLGIGWLYSYPDTASQAWSQVWRAMAPAGPAKPVAVDKSAAAGRPAPVAEAPAASNSSADTNARLPAEVERPPVPAAAILNQMVTPPHAPTADQAAELAAVPPPSGATYAPPSAQPADTLRQRAEAAGLHPEVSRALLARLSPGDFRNASVAIETALAQTPDTEALVWPRQRKSEDALFRVHFVAGAAPQCRRYIVTVTKDGWSTTALPMEKCGAKLSTQKRS